MLSDVLSLNLLVPLLITSVVAILGWGMTHELAARRDRDNNKRDLRVKYLIEAWRKLEMSSSRPSGEQPNYFYNIESAISDIQLFGTPKQIELAQTFADKLSSSQSVNLDELLNDLRRDLRLYLDLPETPDINWWLRFKRGSSGST
jgi:hypothetical protein